MQRGELVKSVVKLIEEQHQHICADNSVEKALKIFGI